MPYSPRHPVPAPDHSGGPWQSWSRPRLLALAGLLMAGNFAWQLAAALAGAGLFMPILAGAVGGVLVPLAYLGRTRGWDARRDLGLDRPGFRVTIYAVLLALAALAPASLLAQVSMRLHPMDPAWADYLQENLPRGPLGLLLAGLTVVVVAPLAEELVFRGLLHRVFASVWGPVPAILISSLVFGLVHAEPWFLFGLIGVGMLLAVIYEASRSVTACWAAHATHNAVSLGLLLRSGQAMPAEQPPTGTDVLTAGISLAICVVLGRLLWRCRRPAGDGRRDG